LKNTAKGCVIGAIPLVHVATVSDRTRDDVLVWATTPTCPHIAAKKRNEDVEGKHRRKKDDEDEKRGPALSVEDETRDDIVDLYHEDFTKGIL